MSSVNLQLDSYQYYSGTIVRGKAVCYFRSNKDVRKVRIRLKGKEYTQWTGTETYYDSVERKHKTRHVEYYGSRDFLLRDNMVHGEGTMSAGEHVFPFEFPLPEDIPSTFQHGYGSIRFTVKVTVDRPWKTDYESEREITVISPIRLQKISSSFLQPAEYSDEKTVCCFCCASGPVQVDVSLEKRAFVVGDRAGVRVYCMNMSNTNVDSVTAEIKMNMRFKTTHPSSDYKHDSELVTTSHNSGVGAHGEKTYNLSLEIPPSTVLPNFTGCELFSCDTTLKVTAAVSGCHTDIDIKTDVALAHESLLSQSPPMSAPYDPYCIQPPPSGFVQPLTMSMPMPQPEFGNEPNKDLEPPPYPVPGYPAGPSAPQDFNAPSAPPPMNMAGNFSNQDGEKSGFELPPPSYDEAAKNFN